MLTTMTDTFYVYILLISFLLSNRKLTEIGFTEGEDEANPNPQTVLPVKPMVMPPMNGGLQVTGKLQSGGVCQLRVGWTRQGSLSSPTLMPFVLETSL